jgi:hypothetical protein
MVKAPANYFTPGDRVMRCPLCDGTNLDFERLIGPGYLFDCKDCRELFILSVEKREEKVCFMWHWGPEPGGIVAGHHARRSRVP